MDYKTNTRINLVLPLKNKSALNGYSRSDEEPPFSTQVRGSA